MLAGVETGGFTKHHREEFMRIKMKQVRPVISPSDTLRDANRQVPLNNDPLEIRVVRYQ
jgi:hypothetical protein